MKIGDDRFCGKTVTLECSGRTFEAQDGVIGIDARGGFSIIGSGWNENVTDSDKFTPAEKREIAAHMIATWTAWGAPFEWKHERTNDTHTLRVTISGAIGFQAMARLMGGFVGNGPENQWWLVEVAGYAPEESRIFATVTRSLEAAKLAAEAAIDEARAKTTTA